MLNVHADFESDLRAALGAKLAQLDYPVAESATAHETAMTYFNVVRRRIEPGRREVRWSRELQRKKAVLPKEQRRALHRITSLCGEGRDLNPFLSLTLNDPEYPDAFMSDWGMHHLHLGLPSGRVPKDPRFVCRGRELLIALVAREAMHLVDVVPHGQWELQELVEILHRNWPKVIAHARCPGVSAASPVSPATRKAMRGRCVLLTEMTDGTVYAPIGGGAATDGTNSRVVEQANAAVNLLWDLQFTCRRHPALVRSAIRGRGGIRLDELRLRLVVTFARPDELLLDVEEITTGTTLCRHFAQLARDEGVPLRDWLWARRSA